MLICQVCGYTHETMISPSHLKKHGISGKEYKKKYPGHPLRIQTAESKEKISNHKRGKTPWNKGISPSESQIEKQRETLKSKYAAGELKHWNLGQTLSDATKRKISEANLGRTLTKEQKEKQKAAINKRVSSPGFAGPMTGKKHHEETIEKLRKASTELAIKRRLKAKEELQRLVENDNLTVTDFGVSSVDFACNTCSARFTFSRQYFSLSSAQYRNSRRSKICPVCHPRNTKKSKKELELLDFIRTLTACEVQSGNRNVIFPLELDIFIPEKQLAFEFCGIYWHSEEVSSAMGREKYHIFEKFLKCRNAGIQLITIFEDEWDLKQEIVKSRIKHLLNCTTEKIHARKTDISLISPSTSSDFLQLHHIQGADRPEIALGCFYGDELVSVMTFKKTNFVKGGSGAEWELNRFAAKTGITVVGGAAKLLSFFRKELNRENLPIISYSDNRWSVGNVYSKLGFRKIGESLPGYWYTGIKVAKDQGLRIHRSNFMRHRLHKIFNKPYQKPECTLSEYEIMKLEGYDRIWDCGTTKWGIGFN